MTRSASANRDQCLRHAVRRGAAHSLQASARTRLQPLLATRTTHFPWFALAFVILACLLSPSALAQTEYRLDGANWAITVPKGWIVAPPAALKAVNDVAQSMVARAGGQPPQYIAQLLPEVPNGRYVLVQRQGALPSGMSFSEFERLTRSQLEAQSQAIAEKLGMKSQPPTTEVDASRHRIITAGTLQAGGTALGYLSVSAFARDAYLIVHAYAPAADFDAALPQLRAIADSLRFDDGAEFVFAADGATPASPSATPSAPSSGPVVRGVIIGAIGGAIIGLIFWILKRRGA